MGPSKTSRNNKKKAPKQSPVELQKIGVQKRKKKQKINNVVTHNLLDFSPWWMLQPIEEEERRLMLILVKLLPLQTLLYLASA